MRLPFLVLTVLVLIAPAMGEPAEPPADPLAELCRSREAAEVGELVAKVEIDPATVSVVDRARAFTGPERWREIFAFVRDEIRTDVYAGMLRGARGTLLARAGNPTDKAVLLATLLKHAKFRSRYALAPATDALRGRIIESMFDASAEALPALIEKIPAEEAKVLAAPIKDETLLAALATHVWVQVRVKNEWIDLDPALPGREPGTAALEASRTVPNLPADTKHRLLVRLHLEVKPTDGDVRTETVLDGRVDVADAVGATVVLVHRSEKADTVFRPTLLFGRRRIEGKPYDVHGMTKAAGGSGGLPDVFGRATAPAPDAKRDGRVVAAVLEVVAQGPGGPDRTIRRQLVDLRAAKDPGPVLAGISRRMIGFAVLPGRVTIDAVLRSIYLSTSAHRDHGADMTRIRERLEADDAAGARKIYEKKIGPSVVSSVPWFLQGTGEMVAYVADRLTARFDGDACTRTYRDGARVLLVTLDPESRRLCLDLGLDTVRTVTAPGKPAKLGDGARIVASIASLAAEEQLDTLLPEGNHLSTGLVFEAARKQKIPMVAIRPDDVAKVDELPIGNLAREGMKRQLATGKELLVPARAPTGEDGATIGYAWYVWDATTGRLTACLPDGADGFVFTAIHTKLSAKYLGWTESILIAFDCYLLSYAGSLVEHAGEDMSWGMYDAVARVEALSLTKSVFMNAAFGGAASLAQWQIGVILANLWLNAITPD